MARAWADATHSVSSPDNGLALGKAVGNARPSGRTDGFKPSPDIVLIGLRDQWFLLVVAGEIEQVDIDGFRKQDTEIFAVGPSDLTGDAAISLFDDRDQFKGLEKAFGVAAHSLCGQVGDNGWKTGVIFAFNINTNQLPRSLLARRGRMLSRAIINIAVCHVMLNGNIV